MSTIEVKVPDIGDFTDVPVIEVFVKPGDAVKAEDSLVTLESDKATMDVPAPSAGVVKELKVKLGDKVSEGTVILTLDSAAAAPSQDRRCLGHRCARRRCIRRRCIRHPNARSEDAAPASATADAGDAHGGQGAGHRRLQGRAGHRGLREGWRHRQGRRLAGVARVRKSDDGCARAFRRRGQGTEGQTRRQGQRGHRDPDAGSRKRCAATARPRPRIRSVRIALRRADRAPRSGRRHAASQPQPRHLRPPRSIPRVSRARTPRLPCARSRANSASTCRG